MDKRIYRKKRRRIRLLHTTEALALVILAAALVGLEIRRCALPPEGPTPVAEGSAQTAAPPAPSETAAQADAAAADPETETESPAQEIPFIPYHTAETDPANYIAYTGVEIDGAELAEGETYQAADTIDFGLPDGYTRTEGIVTFRGDNFRSGAAYGSANLRNYRFSESWSVPTGSTSYNGAVWTGSGWVGQPLMAKWPAETKANMNMYDWAKADDDLVEVIYATMDGCVYFLDLRSGEATRDALNLGYTFKGAGALDPRGYPILYLGSGYDSTLGRSRAFIISLLDCSIMYTFGNEDSFALRGLSYFDSSALVDAATDQLIYPGENGVIYIIKLNTRYDEAAGTLSVAPSRVVKWHYMGVRTTTEDHWLGMEDSAVIWHGYLFIADNGGNLMCLDLNTLELVWVQDTQDDTNGSPVLSLEDGHPYLYIGTSFHLGWRSSTTAPVPIFKIDAENGSIVWQTVYTCWSEDGVSGGVQSTVALGKNDLDGRIYVTVSKTDGIYAGCLVCLSCEDGSVLWQKDGYYTWSSPVLIYNADGSGYVVYCDYDHSMFLLDGLTGETLDTFDTQGGAEASPAVYGDWVVVGTRKCKIWGVHLT